MGGPNDSTNLSYYDPSPLPLDHRQFSAQYRYDGVVRYLCQRLPVAATRRGPDSWQVLLEAGGDGDDITTRLGVPMALQHAGTLAMRDGNAAILLLTDEAGEPSIDLSQPLDLRSVTALRSLLVVEKAEMTPSAWNRSLLPVQGVEPGEVLRYSLSVGRPGLSLTSQVHASRLVMLRGIYVGERRDSPGLLMGGGWGDDSLLVGLQLRLERLDRAERGLARVWDRIFGMVLKTLLPAEGFAAAGLEKVRQRVANLLNLSGRGLALLDRTEDLSTLNQPLAGLSDLSNQALRALCRAAGCSVEELDGQQFGGLGTGADAPWQAALREQVLEWQRRHAPHLRRIYDVALAARGAGVPDYQLVFAPLTAPTEGEVYDLRLKALEGDKRLVDLGIIPRATLYRSRVREGWRSELYPPTAAEERALFAPVTAAPTQDSFSGSALIALDPSERARAAWEVARAALASVPLEGYDPGSEPPAEPHITVCYVGAVDPGDLGALRDAVAEAARLSPPASLRPLAVVALPAGEDGRRPVVLELRETGTLARLSAAVLRAAAPWVTARQYVQHRPHMTLGFAPAGLDLDEVLAAIPVQVEPSTASHLTLSWSHRDIASWDLRETE